MLVRACGFKSRLPHTICIIKLKGRFNEKSTFTYIFDSHNIFFKSSCTKWQKWIHEAAKLYNEGNSQKKSGNFAGALESYQKALKISKDYRIYYQLSSFTKNKENLIMQKKHLLKCIRS